MANQYHSTYRGYDIYYRDDAKRRPWSVYIPQHDRFAAKASLEDCGDMIDKMTHSEPPNDQTEND